MATANTTRRYEIKTGDNGLIGVPIDICTADGGTLERRSFYLSTAATACTMRAEDLKALGYETSDAVKLPFVRIGIYDFYNIACEPADENVIGANVLKWLNFSVSNSESVFEVDLIDRLKPLVEKGVNPNIKSGALSKVKSSRYNDNSNWMTWEEIDRVCPNSWVLLAATTEEEEDFGGEILWCSETETPDTSQEDTILYCNKSIAASKPFLVQYEDHFRCRGYAKADQAFSVFVEELEASLKPPLVNRFYYDTVSRQGKMYMIRKAAEPSENANPNAVLTQAAIDALFAEYGVS